MPLYAEYEDEDIYYAYCIFHRVWELRRDKALKKLKKDKELNQLVDFDEKVCDLAIGEVRLIGNDLLLDLKS